MAIAEVQLPDGQIATIEVPEGATENDIMAFLQQSPPSQFAKPEPASTTEVLTQAPKKALAGFAEQVIQTPVNLLNLAKMAYGTGAAALGRPELAPEVSPPPTPLTDFLKQQNVIRDIPNMTPAQRALDAATQAATLGLMAPGAGVSRLAGAATSAVGGAAGQATEEATGSKLAGMAAGILAPSVAARASGVTAAQREAEALQQVRNQTLAEAQRAGFKMVPQGSAAEFAGRAAMAEEAAAANQQTMNAIARETLGLPKTAPLKPDTFRGVRSQAYVQGYMPLKTIGNLPTDAEYAQALNDIRANYSAGIGSFPKVGVSKVNKEIDRYSVSNFTGEDAVARIRRLREDSSYNLNSKKAKLVNLGTAQRAIADALENQMDRYITSTGLPQEIVSGYRAARQRIAQAHTLEDALKEGAGDISQPKITKAMERGAPLSGDILSAAKFGQVMPDAISGTVKGPTSNIDLQTLFGAGGLLGYGIADQFGLPLNPYLSAVAGGLALAGIKKPIQAGMKQYMMSPVGQARIVPSQSELKRMLSFGAPSALGLLNQ